MAPLTQDQNDVNVTGFSSDQDLPNNSVDGGYELRRLLAIPTSTEELIKYCADRSYEQLMEDVRILQKSMEIIKFVLKLRKEEERSIKANDEDDSRVEKQ